jgi:hypothetical protein
MSDLYFLLFFAAGCLAFELIDSRALPRRTPFAGDRSAFALRMLYAATILALLGALFGRMLPAVLLFLVLHGVAILVSNVKHSILKEPLLFSDFFLIRQIVRHPRLYLFDYRAVVLLCLLIAALATLVGLWAWSEPYVSADRMPLMVRLIALASAAALVALFASDQGATLAQRLTPRPNIARDVPLYGLVLTNWLYARRWLQGPLPISAPQPLRLAPPPPQVIVVVQAESFFQLAQGRSTVDLPGLRGAVAASAYAGELVPSCFGAYTMRTEFAILTGLADDDLGFDQFDPYLRAEAFAAHSLARRLAGIGYATAFVHPFDPAFFRRDRVMHAFGFEQFVDETGFADRDRVGPHVGDRALGRRIVGLAAQSRQPLFVFAVTMENHGPWKPGRLAGATGERDMYERHLANTDAMVTDLAAWAVCAGDRVVLLVYGDHAPALKGGDAAEGDRATPFFLIDNRTAPFPDSKPVSITPAVLHKLLVEQITRFG